MKEKVYNDKKKIKKTKRMYGNKEGERKEIRKRKEA